MSLQKTVGFTVLFVFILGLSANPSYAQEERTVNRLIVPVSRNIQLQYENKIAAALISDYLHSSRMSIDSLNKIEAARYAPYGGALSGNVATDRQFTGHRNLSDTGVYHAGARFYNTQLGMFIQGDSVEGPNRYLYASNNPIVNLDSNGHESMSGFLDDAVKSLQSALRKAMESGDNAAMIDSMKRLWVAKAAARAGHAAEEAAIAAPVADASRANARRFTLEELQAAGVLPRQDRPGGFHHIEEAAPPQPARAANYPPAPPPPPVQSVQTPFEQAREAGKQLTRTSVAVNAGLGLREIRAGTGSGAHEMFNIFETIREVMGIRLHVSPNLSMAQGTPVVVGVAQTLGGPARIRIASDFYAALIDGSQTEARARFFNELIPELGAAQGLPATARFWGGYNHMASVLGETSPEAQKMFELYRYAARAEFPQ